MGKRYFCQNDRRRQAILQHGDLNGIDFLEVLDQDAPDGSPRQQTLLLRFLKPFAAADQILDANQINIEGGVRFTDIDVLWVGWAAAADSLFAGGTISELERDFFLDQQEAEHLLIIRTNAAGDFSTYRLCLVTSPTAGEAPTGYDPVLSCVPFSFKVECPSDFDCQDEENCPPEIESEPQIDYLAKDYASFRQLMLDRLALIMPDWQENNPADLGIALVETLAYAADYASYYQDAVATEAYLGTARKRVSLRRHARLLDYAMHDGCNARVWVHLQASSDNITVPQGSALLTRLAGQPLSISPDTAETLTQPHLVFQTMYPVTLFTAHNVLELYTWGEEDCCLPEGATRATLLGEFPDLNVGDVLIFEETLDPQSGRVEDADPGRRHAVRLTRVTHTADPLGGQLAEPFTDDALPVTEIEWPAADALPFALCITATGEESDEIVKTPAVYGNVVLADHGKTIAAEPLPEVPTGNGYRPHLEEGGITQRALYQHDDAIKKPAVSAINQDPRQALPGATLSQGNTVWQPRRDLLSSNRFTPDFVVETEEDGRAYLRFGDGKTFGQKPPEGASLQATYRIGNGAGGNVGAEAIGHIVTSLSGGISRVRNPLPAQGGVDPESLEEVRLYAPQAFRTQERAVTEADYAAVVQRHPEVQRAAATRRWTGSWHTMFITVDRLGGRPVDENFEMELRLFLERFRLSGHDLEIDAPRFVALDIALTVCVAEGYFRGEVKRALLELFSHRDLADGRRGFFHPDNFTFGQPVYLSRIVAAAMEVPGVSWVDTSNEAGKPNRFQRWGELARDEIEQGRITMERLEIIRLENDPSLPENGKIEFFMEGGL